MNNLPSSYQKSGVYNPPLLHFSNLNSDAVSLEHVASPLTSSTNSEEPDSRSLPSSTPTTISSLIPKNFLTDSQFSSIAGPHLSDASLSPPSTSRGPRSSPYSSRFSNTSSSSNDSPTSTSPLSPCLESFKSSDDFSSAQTSKYRVKGIKRKKAEESEGGGIEGLTGLESSDKLNENEDPKKLRSEIELLKMEKIALKLKNNQLEEIIKGLETDQKKLIAQHEASTAKLQFENLMNKTLLDLTEKDSTFSMNVQGMVTSLNALVKGLQKKSNLDEKDDKNAEGFLI